TPFPLTTLFRVCFDTSLPPCSCSGTVAGAGEVKGEPCRREPNRSPRSLRGVRRPGAPRHQRPAARRDGGPPDHRSWRGGGESLPAPPPPTTLLTTTSSAIPRPAPRTAR